jgi:phosphoglycerate dehydrogenase-like enzyme
METKGVRPVVYIHRVQFCIYAYYMDEENERLLASFADVRNHGNDPEPVPEERMVEHLRGAQAILSLNGSCVREVTGAAVEQAGSVRVAGVSHWWGQAHDDAARAWRAAGVEVVDASYPCNQAVAEWAVGAAIAGLRKFDVFDRELKQGVKWPSWRGVAGQLNGSTVGLVALGRVGRWMLRYLAPFDVRILVYDPYLGDAEAKKLGVELVSLDNLLSTADVISLHAPVTDETRGMIGAREFALIRDGALLVNSARAALLDGQAFRAEMQKKRFRAYLDVYEPEPPPEDDVLRGLDNVVMTPHVAGTTDRMFLRCGRAAIEAIREAL